MSERLVLSQPNVSKVCKDSPGSTMSTQGQSMVSAWSMVNPRTVWSIQGQEMLLSQFQHCDQPTDMVRYFWKLVTRLEPILDLNYA